MEFRCSTCGHVGAPKQVLPGDDDKIVMVCAQCMGRNEVSFTDDAAPADSVQAQKTESTASTSEREELEQEAFARLIPEKGEGFRCPKCIRLISLDDDHCRHCGLTMDAARRFGPEDGPWAAAPAGAEAKHEQALLLWNSVEQEPSAENFDKFIGFTNENELHDLQVRRLRWFLVDQPDDSIATSYLRKVASEFQSTLIVAQATSKARAQQFEHASQDFRRKLMMGTAVFWAILVVLMVFLFFKSQ